MHFDAIVIGGGAAGLFCAIRAGKRGRKVLVLEKNSQLGRKILISGGGRCNFTNRDVSAENFVSENPHFCRSALARYTPTDFIALVREHGIEYYEKTLGRLFCRNSARDIVAMLETECRRARVRIETGCSVNSVANEKGKFTVKTERGYFTAENLVIACGGLSFAKVGATGLGYDIARQFGLKIVETRPSLVPLVFANGSSIASPKSLAGISLDSFVETNGQTFRENILFTHRGLSGPAILQISNYWEPSEPVLIDVLPDIDIRAELENARASRKILRNVLGSFLPERFIAAAIDEKLAGLSMSQISKKALDETAAKIKNWRTNFRATEGYDRAEVTLGGVSTAELSSKTMEASKCPGLYFIGEVVDVTGWLGGYNFQWAWSSGFAAGNAV